MPDEETIPGIFQFPPTAFFSHAQERLFPVFDLRRIHHGLTRLSNTLISAGA
jgi:hypothetical protein